MSAVGPQVSISINQDFRPTRAWLVFYNKCVAWALVLNKVVERGGVSIGFFGPPGATCPIATIWWSGKEVIKLCLNKDGSIRRFVDGRYPERDPVVNDKSIFHELRQGICAAIGETEQRYSSLRARCSAIQWEQIQVD